MDHISQNKNILIFLNLLENHQNELPEGEVLQTLTSSVLGAEILINCPRNKAFLWEALIMRLFPGIKFQKAYTKNQKYYCFQTIIPSLKIRIVLGWWE